MKLSNTTAELLLKEKELETQIEELESKIQSLEPIYARYRDMLLFGMKKEEGIKLETAKLQKTFAKPTLTLDEISSYIGVDSLVLRQLAEDKTLPFKHIYFPSCDDGDVFFVTLDAFAEYIYYHTVK